MGHTGTQTARQQAIITFDKLTYKQKERIANAYLFNIFGMSWDDFADINSLHDAETKLDIIELCQERINYYS